MERQKTGLEVMDEMQEITQPLCEYATVLHMLIGHFDLDKQTPDHIDDARLAAGRDDIHNTIMLVLRGIMDMERKIINFDLQKKSSDPEPTESAN